jgi:hypothetical protein
VFRQNLENVAKVPGSHKDIKGFVPLARVLTMDSALDLFKMLIGECW